MYAEELDEVGVGLMKVAVLVDYAGLYHSAWERDDGQLPHGKHADTLDLL